MATDIATVLAGAPRGVLTAAAGCGKTDAIAASVASAEDGRQLILTHTHAGVKALRQRLQKYEAANDHYHVALRRSCSASVSAPPVARLSRRLASHCSRRALQARHAYSRTSDAFSVSVIGAGFAISCSWPAASYARERGATRTGT